MKKRERAFEPQFGCSEVEELERAYFADESDRLREEQALAAGARIRQGDCSRELLNRIHEWKTRGRGKKRLFKNSDEEISDALRLAISARTERAAVAVLKGL